MKPDGIMLSSHLYMEEKSKNKMKNHIHYQRWREEELNEGNQKVQTSSYKIHKYLGYNLHLYSYGMHYSYTPIWYIWKLLRE